MWYRASAHITALIYLLYTLKINPKMSFTLATDMIDFYKKIRIDISELSTMPNFLRKIKKRKIFEGQVI